MDKKLFLYELKALGKVPLIALCGYGAAWLVCGVLWWWSRWSMEGIDAVSRVALYILFAYLVATTVYRTAAYDRLYAKVNKTPLSLLTTRMLCLAICCAATVTVLLLGGTLMDFIARKTDPQDFSPLRVSYLMFTLCHRSPYYIFFILSVTINALVLYSLCSVVINAVRVVRSPFAKVLTGVVSAAAMAIFWLASANLVQVIPQEPTWGMNELYTYPMPFDPFSYTEYTHAYLTYADVTERAPIFLCYACWNICNIATLTAGLLLIFLAFSANAFFRGGFGRLWKKSGAAGDTLDYFFARGSNGVPRNKNEKIDVADDLSESGTGRWKK